jgi:uncharacterized RDD family membrane protein YckC
MKKKLLLATVSLAVLFSSVISVAAVSQLVRDSRADYPRVFTFDQARAFERSARFQAEQAQSPQTPQTPDADQAPRRGRGPAPADAAAPPTLPIDAPRYDDQFPSDEFFELYRRTRSAFRLGQQLTIGPDDIVRDATVVFGDATVAGRVTGNLTVIFGTARIQSTAIIDGDFVSIGGGTTVQPGASTRRDVVVVGGPLDAPASFAAGGTQIVIGSGMLGGSLDALVPYLSRGLLWGRMIVPDLPWVWGVLTLFFLLYAALNLVFERPVRASALTLHNRPLTAFGTGLLVLLLVGPICVLLAVSIIGIAVVPFVVCALIASALIGKVAVARWIGMTAIDEDPDGNRAHAARSFVVGFAVLTIAYIIPVMGLITWGITGVLGLGSTALAFMAAYRKETPVKPPVVISQPPGVPPPPIVPPPAPAYPHASGGPADSPSATFDGSAAATPTAPPPIGEPAVAGAYPHAYAPAAQGFASSGLLVAQPRAMFRDRLAAFLVDVFVVGVASAFLNEVFDLDGPFFFVLFLIYVIVAWTMRQTTFGGVVCQIRVVRTDGTALSFADALVRGLAGIFSLAVFGLGALWILRDPERQAWHDKIAGTYVVKVPKGWTI